MWAKVSEIGKHAQIHTCTHIYMMTYAVKTGVNTLKTVTQTTEVQNHKCNK